MPKNRIDISAKLREAVKLYWRTRSIRQQKVALEWQVQLRTTELQHEIEQREKAEKALAASAAAEAVATERTRLAREEVPEDHAVPAEDLMGEPLHRGVGGRGRGLGDLEAVAGVDGAVKITEIGCSCVITSIGF